MVCLYFHRHVVFCRVSPRTKLDKCAQNKRSGSERVQGHHWSQLTWPIGAHRLNNQTGSLHGTNLSSCFTQEEEELSLTLLPAFGVLSLLLGCLFWPQREKMHFFEMQSYWTLMCQGWLLSMGGLHSSEEKGMEEKVCGGGIVGGVWRTGGIGRCLNFGQYVK